MSFLGNLFGKRKLTPKGLYFVIVDFSEEAKRRGLPRPKVMYHLQNGYLVQAEEFSDPTIEIQQLRRQGIYVEDKTHGQHISPDSSFVSRGEVLGMLQTNKLVAGMEIRGELD